MKRTVIIIFVALIALPALFYFIPAAREKQVFVGSTFQNVISSLTGPGSWIRWNNDVRRAWLSDSSSYSFVKDTVANTSTTTVSGKKIQVTMRTYLLYDVEEVTPRDSAHFVLSIIPYVGNGQQRSEHNSKIAYAEPTNLLFKIFPFLDHSRFAEKTVADLRSYLEDNTRFYGFPIEIKTLADSYFITKKTRSFNRDIFSEIPDLFKSIEQFAAANQIVPGRRNVSFSEMRNDSVDILAGITINKVVDGNGSINFMQFPPGQIVLTGHFQGPFHDRVNLYKAMEKYMLDHQLIQNAAPYETYLSVLPVADSSIVQIDLSYPLRY